jgi:hypothetical protein
MNAYQDDLRRVILERDAPEAALRALGAEPWRWEAYRRLVRNRLGETLAHGFERLRAFLGEARFRALVDAFLEEQGPRSCYLRDAPGEMLQWIERRGGVDLEPWALDLARLEWAELEVAYAPDPPRANRVIDLATDRPAVLCPSYRVLRLDHPAHRIAAGQPAPEREPTVLCLYRDVTTHAVHTLELSEVVGDLLDALGESEALAGAIAGVAARARITIDEPWLTAMSAVLADFVERGLILGSAA